MYYRGARNTRRRGLIIASVIFALALILDALTGGAVRAPVHSTVAVVTGWVRSGENAVAGRFFGRSAATPNAAVEAAEITALTQENDQLRSIVHIAQGGSGVTVPVISSLTASPYGTFLIGGGSNSGIGQGDLVLSPEGFVIGTVTTVQGGIGVVAELLAPGATLEATVHGATVTLEGDGGGNGRADAPRALSIQIGDVVTSASFGQRPIAVVGDIASTTASAAQTLYVQLPVNRSALQYVYVTPSHS